MANYSDIRYEFTGVAEYATADNLPTSGNTTGDQALVTGTNRLYIWNGSGWYNIALINTTPSISGVSSSYELAADGTATTVTITATDPEGIPIVYSIASDTSGNVATVTQGTGASANVFTITPSTNGANAGTFSLTFRASDGVNIATAVSSFTLAFTVQNSNYTTALITSVGANNAVNNDFVDSSTNSHTITATGNVTQNTFSPYRHGGYSTYFDGSGDYLNLTNLLAGHSTAFTIEAWVYHTAFSQYSNPIFTSGNNGSVGADFFEFGANSSGTYQVFWGGGTPSASTSVNVPVNTWTHIALVRAADNSSCTIYVNGISRATFSKSGGIPTPGSSNRSFIGTQSYSEGTNTRSFYGYMSNVRITTSAVYTSAFTPPIERLTAVANTSLLTCHLPYIADGSTNGYAITVNGNIKTEQFAPYDYETYSASTNGGSIYFDGSGDYLQAPAASVARGTGNWTIECWAYFYSLATTNIIWDARTGATPTDDFLSVQSDGSLRYRSNGITVSSAGVVRTKVWHHIAQVLNSGTLKTYIDGTEVTSSSQTSNLSLGASLTIGGSLNDNANWCNANFADFRVVLGTAVYTSAFTPPTAPLTAISGTSLLLKGTNAGIIDKSQSVQTLTLNGNVSSSTTQTKYLSSSMAFDGTNDYITVPAGNNLTNLGTGDFTVESWFYPNSTSWMIPWDFRSGSDTDHIALFWSYTTGKYTFYESTGFRITSTSTFSANQWHHVAVTRASGTCTLWVNGTSQGTATVNTNQNGDNLLWLGRYYLSNAYDYNGYISDFRITKGLARYTANFTAPTAALSG
jgi:hypothetical protein